jgi:hypothetical protein
VRQAAADAGDAGAEAVAAGLAAERGFEPVELEPLAVAWVVLSRQRGLGVDFALDVARRPGNWPRSGRSEGT